MTTSNEKIRSVTNIVNASRQLEGAGFVVNRPFPSQGMALVDPFLLLDEMGPMELGPGEAKGAPDHPHRGFETVTYMISGKMEHRDSHGNAGRIGPGDVQWMTAGAGVVHSEMPAEDFQRQGGRMHGFQLWVNLPRRDKMIRPHYQEISAASIPTATSPDGKAMVRVIAGEALGAKAVIDTRTPISYLHFTLKPGARVVQPVPADYNAFAYVFSGEGRFGRDEKAAVEHQMVMLAGDGDAVSISVPQGASEPLEVLLIAGVPLREPVARYGPFVMNTKEEIVKAFEDYREGRMGEIAPG
ncbi:MAG TPA: pirin family protein [Candidatus Binataceae bacterium]|nr:pirin family protein [Candidatus Binataceae bacterium]